MLLKGINDIKGVKIISEKVNILIETNPGKFRINNAIAIEELSLATQSISCELSSKCKAELADKVSHYKVARTM